MQNRSLSQLAGRDCGRPSKRLCEDLLLEPDWNLSVASYMQRDICQENAVALQRGRNDRMDRQQLTGHLSVKEKAAVRQKMGHPTSLL